MIICNGIQQEQVVPFSGSNDKRDMEWLPGPNEGQQVYIGHSGDGVWHRLNSLPSLSVAGCSSSALRAFLYGVC